MKEGWEIKDLGDVCHFQNGFAFKSKTFKEYGEPVVRITNIQNDSIDSKGFVYIDRNDYNKDLSKYEVKKGDLLIAMSGATTGKIGIHHTEQVLLLNQRVGLFKPQETLNKQFLYYFLSTKVEESLSISAGAAQPNLSTEQIKSFKIPIPPLPEQQRIVSILDRAFAAIAKAKANAEQNLQNAKELFESYLQGVFSEVFDSNERRTVKELAKVIGGYSFKSKDFKKEGQYQVIRMGNVRPGIIRENENPVFINDLDEKVLSRALLQPDDVIITQTGTKKKRDYGFTVIIEKDNYLLNQRIAAIRFNELYLPKFFLYFSWTDLFKDQYFANETGTVGQGNVGIKAITDAEVPFLSLERQEQIIENIELIHSETQSLEAIYQKKIADLEELKKSILQKAFSGQLSESRIMAD